MMSKAEVLKNGKYGFVFKVYGWCPYQALTHFSNGMYCFTLSTMFQKAEIEAKCKTEVHSKFHVQKSFDR